MRSANRLLDVLGLVGPLRLHLPCTKFPIRYLVDSQKLICLSKIRNVISNRNQATWTNTDTRTSPRAFYEPTHNQKIDVHEMGGVGAFNDFAGRLGNMGDLKRDEGAGDAVAESKSLIRGKRVESNSADNEKIAGSSDGRIAKTPNKRK